MSTFSDKIPVTILTGFLGAGKSTLLNRILKDPAMKDAAVIINEFGDVGIDHLLVESSGDSIIELSDGCLCCTVRGELVDTLANLMDAVQTGRVKPVKRVVIETTGLADPAPVMQAIMGNPIVAQNFELDGVVTVVDAVNGLQTLDNHEEARKQTAVADRLIVSKQSIAGDTDALMARLHGLNPRAAIMDADSDEAGSARIFVNGLYDPGTKIADVRRWLHDEDEHEGHHRSWPRSRSSPPSSWPRASGPARRQSSRCVDPFLLDHRGEGNRSDGARNVHRSPAFGAWREASAHEGDHRHIRPAGTPAGAARRPEHLPPAGAACCLAGS